MSYSYQVSIRLEETPQGEVNLARDPGTKEGPLIEIIRDAVKGEYLTVEDGIYLRSPNTSPPHFLIGVKTNDKINIKRIEDIMQEQWMMRAEEGNGPAAAVDINIQEKDGFWDL